MRALNARVALPLLNAFPVKLPVGFQCPKRGGLAIGAGLGKVPELHPGKFSLPFHFIPPVLPVSRAFDLITYLLITFRYWSVKVYLSTD